MRQAGMNSGNRRQICGFLRLPTLCRIFFASFMRRDLEIKQEKYKIYIRTEVIILIDLRSDTVTKPTPQMRQAMYNAEVGDDVYREDPSVSALEELAAGLTGKEAGLFLPSGTMGNQVAVMTHTKKGDEIICEAQAHIYNYEVAGLACLSAVQARPVRGERGILQPETVREAIRPQDVHFPDTGLICIENTHNRAGGTFYTAADLAALQELAGQGGIPVHMDGARLFNAAVAQKIKAWEIAQYADSVQFCLSKGLAAPVGSLLVGKKSFIEKARRNRKLLGGGMRQAGILAAAGIVALETMVERLAEDHANAKFLAEGLANAGFEVDLPGVQTNIVIIGLAGMKTDAALLSAELKKRGLLANAVGERKLRLVTHYGVTGEDIVTAVSIMAALYKSFS